MLIYIYFFIPLRASKQLLSELINIHKLSFAIGRSASNVQPALININELDLGNSRTRNLVSSPSHSAAASGTEEEPSRRHTGARYRTLPPYSSSSWLCHSPGFCWYSLQMNDTCFMDLPPTEKRPHIHTQHQQSLIMHQMIIKAAAAVSYPAPVPGQIEHLGPFVLFNECRNAIHKTKATRIITGY